MTQVTGGYKDLRTPVSSVPRPASRGHAPDADILCLRVAEPGSHGASAGQQEDPGMRGPGDDLFKD